MTTDKGKPSLREFEVYRGTGRIFNDPNGAQAIQVMGQ
jgi:hypothetical protein